VRELFATAERERGTFWVPVLVVLEAIWVLESAYGVSRDELIDTLNDLLLLPVLDFEHRAAVQQTLAGAARHAIELPDLLIAETARLAGCDVTLTFDRRAARAPGFELMTA
jgi:predicted nucleic-acid-binding protein